MDHNNEFFSMLQIQFRAIHKTFVRWVDTQEVFLYRIHKNGGEIAYWYLHKMGKYNVAQPGDPRSVKRTCKLDIKM